MAADREPPPFSDDTNALENDDDDDIFKSVAEKPQMKLRSQDDNEDKEDIFADAVTEVPLDSPASSPQQNGAAYSPMAGNMWKQPAKNPFEEVESSPAVIDHQQSGRNMQTNSSMESVIETIPEDESPQIEVKVTDPVKRGEGMSAYMAYKVNTRTSLARFRSNEMSVYRRFSDFLGLQEHLVSTHQVKGYIVPIAPEKSVVGMTKIKMSKEDQGSSEFVERRRAALERFLNRIARHPSLREDEEFIKFIEREDELPKSNSTSALSKAGVLRLFNKMEDGLSKITFRMEETDQWFEMKQQEVESLDHELRKLHSSIEALVHNRKELSLSTGQVARSVALLGNTEENTAISRALSQLAEIEEKLDQVHMEQSDNDFYVFAELVKDYIGLISSVKDVFNERVKVCKILKDAEAQLNKKREEKSKLELQRKLDKVPAVAQEITKFEQQVESAQEDFDEISKTIRKELIRFDKQRVREFKASILNYLETLLNCQEQVVKYWETFLPEAQAIS